MDLGSAAEALLGADVFKISTQIPIPQDRGCGQGQIRAAAGCASVETVRALSYLEHKRLYCILAVGACPALCGLFHHSPCAGTAHVLVPCDLVGWHWV